MMILLNDDIASSINPRIEEYNVKSVSNAIRYLSKDWFIENIEGYSELFPDKKPSSARELLEKLIDYHSYPSSHTQGEP